jgi:hypothetical protein
MGNFTHFLPGQKWVKRRAVEDDWSVWDCAVVAAAGCAFRDRMASTR